MSRSTQTAGSVETQPVAGARGGLLTTGRSLGLGLLAGVGASLCCLPILLLLAGMGGAWMGSLTAMEPYRPYLMGLTVVFLGLAFWKLYVVPRRCADGEACATPKTLRRQRALLWSTTILVGLLVGIPYYAPYLIG